MRRHAGGRSGGSVASGNSAAADLAREQAAWPLITAAAQKTGLDWWLIYGVIEQESSFDPTSESSCGALGLMQLMPTSFPSFTRTQLLDPATNVKLGAEFLRECIAIWKLESADEAIKFGLASYNGGSGYVLAAQHAAANAGLDPSVWQCVRPFLAAVECDGKRPDVRQITGYVQRIWGLYQGRRGRPLPTAGQAPAGGGSSAPGKALTVEGQLHRYVGLLGQMGDLGLW